MKLTRDRLTITYLDQFMGARRAYSHFLLLLLLVVSVEIAGQEQSGNTEAKLVSSEEFKLSYEAAAAGITGTIKVGITVNKDGLVLNPRLIAGPSWPCSAKPKKELEKTEDAIVKNLLAARFNPALKDGKPAEASLIVTFAVGEEYRKAVQRRLAAEGGDKQPPVPSVVRSGVINGKALRLPKPDYPAEARPSRISGTVGIEVLIDENGVVIQAGATNGHPALQNAARNAACQRSSRLLRLRDDL